MQVMYVSFAAKDGDLLSAPFAEPDPDFYEGAPGGKMAYDRQFTHLDMSALWDEAPPSEELLRQFAVGAEAGLEVVEPASDVVEPERLDAWADDSDEPDA